MENTKDKDSLENLFNQMFNEDELLMKKEGWNVPNAELWDSIEEQLPKAAPKKRMLYSHWIATAASVLLVVSCFQLVQYQEKIDLLSSKLIATENAVVDIKKEMAVLASVKKMSTTEESSILPINKERIEKSEFPYNLSSKNISVNTTKISTKIVATTDNQPSSSTIQFAVTAASLSNSAVGMEVTTNPLKEQQIRNIGSTDKLIISKKARQVAAITPLPILLSKLVIEQKKAPIETYPILSAAEKKYNWYVSASVAPVRHELKRKSRPNTNSDFVNKEMPQEKAFATNIQAGIQLANNWSVESGIRYANYQHLSNHSKQISYPYLEEHLNTKGAYESKVQVEMESGASIAEATIILSRNPTTTIEKDATIKMDIDFASSLAFIDIPVLIGKQWQKGNWSMRVKTGIANRFLVKNGVDLKQVKLNDDRFSTEPIVLQAIHKSDEPSIYSARYVAAMDIAYAISSNLDIYASPTFSRSIQPIADSNRGTIHSQEQALNVGVRYHL